MWRVGFRNCLLVLALAPGLSGCWSGDREWTNSVSGAGILGDSPPYLDPYKSVSGDGQIGRAARPPASGHVEFGRGPNDTRRGGDDGPATLSASHLAQNLPLGWEDQRRWIAAQG